MPAKDLMFGEAAHARIVKGMNTLAEAVRVTLGPKARTVVLERPYGPPTVINSGVIVAREIELGDRFENMGAQMMREVATKTSEVAGDGTTTAIVLAAGIVTEGMKYVAAVSMRWSSSSSAWRSRAPRAPRSRRWLRSPQTMTGRSVRWSLMRWKRSARKA